MVGAKAPEDSLSPEIHNSTFAGLLPIRRIDRYSLKKRRYKRYKFESFVEIRWIGVDGVSYFAVGSGIDISVFGMGVELSAFIPVGTEVSVRIDRIELSSKAVIRNSRQHRFGTRVGIEFEKCLASDLVNIDGELGQALEQDSRTSSEVAVAPNQAVQPTAVGVVRRVLCLLTGHDLEWNSQGSRAVLVCSRCGCNIHISVPQGASSVSPG